MIFQLWVTFSFLRSRWGYGTWREGSRFRVKGEDDCDSLECFLAEWSLNQVKYLRMGVIDPLLERNNSLLKFIWSHYLEVTNAEKYHILKEGSSSSSFTEDITDYRWFRIFYEQIDGLFEIFVRHMWLTRWAAHQQKLSQHGIVKISCQYSIEPDFFCKIWLQQEPQLFPMNHVQHPDTSEKRDTAKKYELSINYPYAHHIHHPSNCFSVIISILPS